MAESEIFASPERIKLLAENLVMTANSLRAEIRQTEDALRRLGSTWRDQEFNKFKRVFDRLSLKIDELESEIRKRNPELREDAERLTAYLQREIPGH